ncbi:Protein slit [Gryllus bimaculatus]|nr:Protein slit [Gryllus bimaculatus]
MPALRSLSLRGNALQQLEDGALAGLSRLQLLDLADNRLEDAHPRALRDQTALRELRLRGNRLAQLSADLLRRAEGLRVIDELDASRNALRAFPLPEAGDFSLPALRALDLSHNLLAEAPATAAALRRALPALQELRLGRNRLRELRADAFADLPHLQLLDLSGNELRELAPGAVRALPRLRALRLSHNRLRALPAGAAQHLPHMLSAELQHNEIAEMAPGFIQAPSACRGLRSKLVRVPQEAPRLLLLNLSHNALEAVERAGLRGLRSLEVLDLSHNRLARVAQDSLAGVDWLVELRMDDNRICSVQGAPFSHMARLRVLSLRNNRMSALRERAFRRLRAGSGAATAQLRVEGNPLACACGVRWLRDWLPPGEPGPRCADGQLLRERALAEGDDACPGGRRDPPPAPGCPDAPDGHAHSAVRDSTPAPSAAPSPPSPEESEYFYDEYVEYQYDENATAPAEAAAAAGGGDVPALVAVVTAAPPPHHHHHQHHASSTLSPHLVPGDTPTLYAGSTRGSGNNQPTRGGETDGGKWGEGVICDVLPQANKTVLVPPQPGQQAPPPASGITFFGFPLPSLSLGGLWGSARKSDAATSRHGEVSHTPPPAPPPHN